jgi:hypothetical protein
MTPKIVLRSGERFGRWVLVRESEYLWGRRAWTCRCDCGNEAVVAQGAIRAGRSRSCGCLHREELSARLTTHGGTNTPEHRAWKDMKGRCLNPDHEEYRNYGARGISVCSEWLDSFPNFLRDMGHRPSPKHSVDRYPNNDGNYEPRNCRWGTDKEQQNNTRRNRLLTVKGKTQTLQQWAEEFGISNMTLSSRLRLGWSVENAVTLPIINNHGGRKSLHANPA